MTTLDVLEEFLRELKYGQIKRKSGVHDPNGISAAWCPDLPGRFIRGSDFIVAKTFNHHKVTFRVHKDGEVTFIRKRRKSKDAPVNVKLCNPGSLGKIKRLLNF